MELAPATAHRPIDSSGTRRAQSDNAAQTSTTLPLIDSGRRFSPVAPSKLALSLPVIR